MKEMAARMQLTPQSTLALSAEHKHFRVPRETGVRPRLLQVLLRAQGRLCRRFKPIRVA
jgi:hypothetical protein